MARHVEMQDPTPIVGKDDKHEQDAAGERGHREEIDRDGRVEVPAVRRETWSERVGRSVVEDGTAIGLNARLWWPCRPSRRPYCLPPGFWRRTGVRWRQSTAHWACYARRSTGVGSRIRRCSRQRHSIVRRDHQGTGRNETGQAYPPRRGAATPGRVRDDELSRAQVRRAGDARSHHRRPRDVLPAG